MEVVAATMIVTSPSVDGEAEADHAGAPGHGSTADPVGAAGPRSRGRPPARAGRKIPGARTKTKTQSAFERAVVGLAEAAEREDLEQVGGDAGDGEPGADRERALGHGQGRR